MGADEIATTEAIDGSYEKRFDDYLNTVSKNPEKVNDVVKTFYGLTSEDSINNEYEEFINKTGKNAVERDILRKKLENSGKSKEEVALAYAKIKLLNSVKGPNEQITLRSGKEVEDLFGELKKDNNNDAQVITAMKATVQKGTYTGKNNGYQITQENIENYKRVRDSYIQEIGEIAPIGEIVEETEDETPVKENEIKAFDSKR